MQKVTCALIFRKGKILIAQRDKNSDHPYQWEFPGGKINPGETPEECIIREIYEELNIEIEITKQLAAVIFDYGFKKIELIPFVCLWKSGSIKPTEHRAIKWILPEEMMNIDFSGADHELICCCKNLEKLKEYSREDMGNA